MVHYVQFFRGSPESYANLKVKNMDTLYFLSDNNMDEGKLYLGTKEISGTSFGDMTLSDISNIEINEGTLHTGDVLIYNEDTRKWISSKFADIAETMIGATANLNGSGGIVPAPKAGDQNKFLKGDGTWALSPAGNVDYLNAVVSTLIDNDYGMTVREIAAEEIASVVGDAPESLDTLQEIAAWIQEHPSGVAELNERIAIVESGLQTVNGDLFSLNNRVTTLENNAFQGDINSTILALQQKDADLESSISELDNRLKWQNL